jgi:hypothetical protein
MGQLETQHPAARNDYSARDRECRMYRDVRTIKGQRWQTCGEYDPADLIAGLGMFQGRG